MATPSSNSFDIEHFDAAPHDDLVEPLLFGTKWGGDVGTGVVELTYSFPTSPQPFMAGYGNGEPGPLFYALSEPERDAVRLALAEASESANITFVEVADNISTVGELRFAGVNTTEFGLAHAYLPFLDFPESGDAWFSNAWNPPADAVPKGSEDYMAILHELGHALGLDHPFQEAGAPPDPSVLPAELDHLGYTVMSYNAVPGDSVPGADFYPTTYMYLDLLALQTLYGPSTTANLGNTTYAYDDSTTYWETINDSGGVDTIIYNASTSGHIDLSNEISHFSNMGLFVHFTNGDLTRDTISIGPGAVIENATGGNGNDTILGNDVDNFLSGRAGSDSVVGGAGNDTIAAAGGNDHLFGGDGADSMLGGAGNDLLLGQAGDDSLDGGEGEDTFTAAGGNDVLLGGNGNDSIVSGGGDDKLAGGEGNDAMLGQSENDSLDGGNGADTMTGAGGHDALFGGNGDDNVVGGGGNDVLAGAAGNDTVLGGNGDDTMTAAGGADELDGGEGNDSIISGGGNDTLVGGEGDDLLAGQAENDSLEGGNGNDTLQGAGGNDTQSGGEGADSILGGGGNDELEGDNGDDSLDGGEGNDELDGGEGNDVLIGAEDSDTLVGGNGDDSMDAGVADGAVDVFNYAATALDSADLLAGDSDTISALEATDQLDISDELAALLNGTTTGASSIAGLQEGETLDGSLSASNNIAFDSANDLLMIDFGADSIADFTIELAGVASVTYTSIGSFFTFTLT